MWATVSCSGGVLCLGLNSGCHSTPFKYLNTTKVGFLLATRSPSQGSQGVLKLYCSELRERETVSGYSVLTQSDQHTAKG